MSVSWPFQKRFEDALKKLKADLEMKMEQLDMMKEQQRLQAEGGVREGDTEGEGMDSEGGDGLFGSDDDMDAS
jgi:transcription initiation factor TFIID subunit 7